MIYIIKYRLTFKYEIDDLDKWVDDFEVNKDCEIIIYNGIRRRVKKYMDKSGQATPTGKFDVAIYSKNKWIILNNGVGYATKFDKLLFKFKLKIIDYSFKPVLSMYKFTFEYHILLTILSTLFDAEILELENLIEAKVRVNGMLLRITGRALIAGLVNMEEFEDFCEELKEVYMQEEERFKLLFNKLDKPDVIPGETHRALAYEIWYNAKRASQREWPRISSVKIERCLEFPEKSGVYYWHPLKIVGLAKRHDANAYEHIPSLFLVKKNSGESKVPNEIRTIYNVTRNLRELEDEKYVEVDYKGREINAMVGATVLVFNNLVIRKYDKPILGDFEAQILNEIGRRSQVLRKGVWFNETGPRIIGIPALPYNYKQIIHDANKMGNLKMGPIMDLTNIGIYNGEEITYPDTEDLYVSKLLETRRLLTFKVRINTEM